MFLNPALPVEVGIAATAEDAADAAETKAEDAAPATDDAAKLVSKSQADRTSKKYSPEAAAPVAELETDAADAEELDA